MTDLIERAKAALESATPGPWYAIRNVAFWEVNPQREFGDDHTPHTVADCCQSDPSDTTGLQETNARLIALAPDLARLAVAAGKLADAVHHERNMPCQDMNMQMKAAQAVDDALARFRAIAEGKADE